MVFCQFRRSRGLFLFLGFFLGFLFVGILFQSAHSHAAIGINAHFSPGEVLFGSEKLSEGRRAVLIGTRSDDSRYPTAEDLRAIGFGGALPPAPHRMDPSYLILLDEKGVESIYSFELGSFFTDAEMRRFGSPKSREQYPNLFKQFEHPEKRAGLPPKLLSVQHAKGELTARFAGEVTLTGAQFAPLVGIPAAIILLIIKQDEKIKDRQASFLSRAIDLELRNHAIPELSQAFSKDELEQLAAALLIRYNIETQWKGLIVPSDKQVEYYYETMTERDRRALEHLETLQKYADSKGLVLSKLGPGFALLSIPRDQIELNPNRKVSSNVQAWLDRFKNLPASSGELIPYGIYALDEKMKNFDLVSYDVPLKGAIESRIMDFTHLAEGIGFNFLPLVPGIAVGTGSFFLENAVSWLGFTFCEYRLAAYGRLQANLKLGVVDMDDGRFDGKKIIVEVLLEHARLMGIPEKEITRMSDHLRRAGPEELGRAIARVMNELIEVESRYASVLETTHFEEIRRTKLIHLARMKNWLKEERSEAPVPERPMFLSMEELRAIEAKDRLVRP